jgi:hypothetical protein
VSELAYDFKSIIPVLSGKQEFRDLSRNLFGVGPST